MRNLAVVYRPDSVEPMFRICGWPGRRRFRTLCMVRSRGILPAHPIFSYWSSLSLRTFLTELMIVCLGALIYFLVRGAVVDRFDEAVGNAIGLIAIERSLGMFWENEMQQWVLASPLLVDFLNGAYFWGHMPVIGITAIVLFTRSRVVYRFTRNTFVISASIALIFYAFLPVAPPRLLPEYGFVDTLALYGNASYQAQELGPFVNPYAAVPSLHFGWAILLSVGLWRARPRSYNKPLFLSMVILLPTIQFFSVILTANHFILDLVVGAGVAMLAVATAAFWDKRVQDLPNPLKGLKDRL